MSNKKQIDVKRIYLKHEDKVHVFVTTSSPFVCNFCTFDINCDIIVDGLSEEPIDILNMTKYQKEYRYESKHFYGVGYCTDVISLRIKIINAYVFSILITRDSAFLEMPMDFHEVISQDILTPKFIHEKLLEKLIMTTKTIECFKKLLDSRQDEHQDFLNSNSFVDVY